MKCVFERRQRGKVRASPGAVVRAVVRALSVHGWLLVCFLFRVVST